MGTKLAVDVIGRVVSATSSRAGHGPLGRDLGCDVGNQVGLYAVKGVAKPYVHFGCGRLVYAYKRGFTFSIVGTAISA